DAARADLSVHRYECGRILQYLCSVKCARSHALVTSVGTLKGRQVYQAACRARETLKERVLETFEANRGIYGA
ncbi:hypothetical protein, partial [Ferrimicrobium acidiphilum]|uniref:hypothetical protein n=1 Tax=Ferrimicrobium acidiphilum TaxID=121039 RepID=UPI0023F11953